MSEVLGDEKLAQSSAYLGDAWPRTECSSEQMEACLAIRRRVFDGLYRTHRERLLRYFRHRGHGIDASEDMVQDVFVRLSTASDAQLRDRPGAMVFRVAKFVSVDAYRRRTTQSRAGFDSQVDISTFDLADKAPTPEQVLIWREAVLSLYKLAGDLPRRCGEAIVCHRILGLTHSEIAEIRGVKLKAIEKRVSAGARRFDEPARLVAQAALAY